LHFSKSLQKVANAYPYFFIYPCLQEELYRDDHKQKQQDETIINFPYLSCPTFKKRYVFRQRAETRKRTVFFSYQMTKMVEPAY
jgi:hypothetical protein